MKKIPLFFISLCLSLHALHAIARIGIFPQADFDNLSYGLYWFGADNQYEKAGVATQHGSLYYDPAKPTLILIHGWQKDDVLHQDRSVFWETDNGYPDIDFANLWIAADYNVGILYWDQFADEAEVKDAEAKIWAANGPQGMRWRDSYGDYHTGPAKNVTELLLTSYLTAMQGYTGKDIRLAGHSLGNQLALRLAGALATQSDAGSINQNLVPQRVSLLDAFYSNYSKSYLDGQWVGEAAREIVSRLKPRGIAIDSYRTSSVTSTFLIGDENTALHNSVAFVEELTQYFSQLEQSQKHHAALWLYLWSIVYPTPPVTDSTMPGISAKSTNQEIKQWMATTDHLRQTEGGDTKDPQDNIYRVTSAL
jgi:hypothetical protein